MATITQTESRTEPYKYQWARFVARKSLETDLAAVKDRISVALKAPTIDPELKDRISGDKSTIGGILRRLEPVTGLGIVPPEPGKFKIGIVGAGVAGLFTAMLLDWLNKEVDGLDISYDILEAAGEERLGGRLYTHEFSKKDHDYYDVGAMRFPDNEVMRRTFRLFNLIGLHREKGGLIEYHFKGKNCTAYFNDIHKVGNPWTNGENDPFNINCGFPDGEKIPEHLLRKDPDDIVKAALADVVAEVEKRYEAYEKSKRDKTPLEPGMDPWKYLMKTDNMSVRQFFSTPKTEDQPGIPEPEGYNYNTIEWLESATYGTGWYDQALSECVLEQLDFDTKEGEKFWCIEGGAQRIARMMRKKIQRHVQLNSRVMAIDANVEGRNPKEHKPMTLTISHTCPYTKKTETRKEDYLAVFNSTTLPALQRMDLRNAGLLWGTKQAIRALGYGASCKVAIKFSKPWWRLKPYCITEGGISHTDLPLRVCVYPSYNLEDNVEESAVLLCSYTWGQDAQRLGSLISPDTPNNEEELKRVLLHNLALLHAKKKEDYDGLHALLQKEYLTHHAWDWYRDENMGGAFAYFGPGQFSNMWEEIVKPNAFGQLYLIGEAASAHHAWVVGALESVVRAVYLLLEGLSSHHPKYKAYDDAMTLLSQSADKETDLPFYPLPVEMPRRQVQTQTEEEPHWTDNPADKEGRLTFPAAVASLSLIESFLELKYEVKG